MTTPNRAALLTKIHKVLKRSYKHHALKGDQPLLESLLFAACLENARHEVAEEAYTKVRAAFFDWNEIRVSTVKELAEVMHMLPEASEAAARLKGILQSVFESDYSFDLEPLKKQNIGVAVKRLQKLQGTSPFVVAYGTQTALGGHSIPVDKGSLGVFYVLGVISEAEAQEGIVPGMERAIPKSKGAEFGGLLHEVGAEFFANPFSQTLRDFLLSIAADAKDRFPKRAPKKPPVAPAPVPVKLVADGKKKEKAKEIVVAKKPIGKNPAKRAVHAPKTAAQAKKKPAATAKKTVVKSLAKRKPR
jgi:endonuclease III